MGILQAKVKGYKHLNLLVFIRILQRQNAAWRKPA